MDTGLVFVAECAPALLEKAGEAMAEDLIERLRTGTLRAMPEVQEAADALEANQWELGAAYEANKLLAAECKASQKEIERLSDKLEAAVTRWHETELRAERLEHERDEARARANTQDG